ncbi:MAG: deoxyribodipyrimidine photo-lyase, partial [Alphaproteobacteria bacterium]
MPDSPTLVWFRQDLRLTDNPALRAAAGSGRPVICVYVLDDETPRRWKAGGAARWWLHHSLNALGHAIEKKGGTLILRRGRADREILRLVRETGAEAVRWNRCYEPFAVKCERQLETALGRERVKTESFNAALLYEPGSVCTRNGDPYKVFSAFWRAAREIHEPETPESAPERLPGPSPAPESDRLEEWDLLPRKPDWAGGLRETWT